MFEAEVGLKLMSILLPPSPGVISEVFGIPQTIDYSFFPLYF